MSLILRQKVLRTVFPTHLRITFCLSYIQAIIQTSPPQPAPVKKSRATRARCTSINTSASHLLRYPIHCILFQIFSTMHTFLSFYSRHRCWREACLQSTIDQTSKRPPTSPLVRGSESWVRLKCHPPLRCQHSLQFILNRGSERSGSNQGQS